MGPQCQQVYVFCLFSMNPKDVLLYELCIRGISSDADFRHYVDYLDL